MFPKKRVVILVIIAVFIKLFAFFPSAVEKYYSTGIYPSIAMVQRGLFGWIPFSIGDLFYAFIVIWLIFQSAWLWKRIAAKRAGKQYLLQVGGRVLVFVLSTYILFNILWGLNYNREGIASQLNLQVGKYSKEDLYEVMQLLVYKLNALDSASKPGRAELQHKRVLFAGAVGAYTALSEKNPLFNYRVSSVKPSLYSYLGNYLGFTGYYNPFSGEAQVNTTVPLFIRPFTTCHEIGHQLGYAKESEANFAGYLSASASEDAGFRYSVYFDMYSYAGKYLYSADSLSLKKINAQLSPAVKADFRELRQFIKRYENPVESIIDRLYGQYLKANEQPSGKMSYSEVVALLIAHYKKDGKL